MSIDGTDFLLAMNYWDKYYSYKFKKSGLRYEVGLNIITGDICWWHGPYEPGMWNDLMIFRDVLMGDLPPGERVEADKGYKGEAATYVNCPPFETPDRVAMAKRMRLRHETCNKRFKQWNILKAPYRHDLYEHQSVFGAIACLTQIAFENDEPLFPVDYF